MKTSAWKNRQIAGIEINGNQEIHPNRHPMAPSGACAMVIQEVGFSDQSKAV